MTQSKFLIALSALAMSSVTLAAGSSAEAQSAAPAPAPAVGKMLYSAGGQRLAAIYKVDAAGGAQILLDGRLVTVPAATLSSTAGRIETSLSRRDLLTAR